MFLFYAKHNILTQHGHINLTLLISERKHIHGINWFRKSCNTSTYKILLTTSPGLHPLFVKVQSLPCPFLKISHSLNHVPPEVLHLAICILKSINHSYFKVSDEPLQ